MVSRLLTDERITQKYLHHSHFRFGVKHSCSVAFGSWNPESNGYVIGVLGAQNYLVTPVHQKTAGKVIAEMFTGRVDTQIG